MITDWIFVPDSDIRAVDQRRYDARLSLRIDGRTVAERARDTYDPYVHRNITDAAVEVTLTRTPEDGVPYHRTEKAPAESFLSAELQSFMGGLMGQATREQQHALMHMYGACACLAQPSGAL